MRNAALKVHSKIRSEIRSKGQLTIPTALRQATQLSEGDMVELELTRDGILLRPLKLIDATQTWFWEERWQAKEREASADIKQKKTTKHKNSAAFLASLDHKSNDKK